MDGLVVMKWLSGKPWDGNRQAEDGSREEDLGETAHHGSKGIGIHKEFFL